ncbi:MAG: dihydrofolate reductase family protein, partial [Candidatus Velamenicoccus archaeovorus]
MRKLIVDEFVSLDGVVQAPGGPDEDPSGGFTHGGWHMPFMDDEIAQRWVMRGIEEMGGLVLGRRTYEIFAAYWPNAPEEERVVAEPLNAAPKHVASTTLTEPLDWRNSSLLKGDVADAVAELKREDGKDLHVIGSSALVHTLTARGVVDEYRLMIDPIVLGGGKPLFEDDGRRRALRLVESEVTAGGAILATYV